MRILRLTLCLCLTTLISHAQVSTLLSLGRYGGIQGGMLNPSTLSINRLNWDVQLVSASTLFTNDAFSLDKTNLISLISQGKALKIDAGNAESIIKNINADKFIREHLNPKDNYLFFDTRVSGLSFFVALSPRLSIGLFNQANTLFSSTSLKYTFAKHAFEGINYAQYLDSTIEVKNNSWNLAAWIETGVSASYTFIQNRDYLVSGGVSLKNLTGIGGNFSQINDIKYIVPKEDSLQVLSADIEWRKTVPNSSNLLNGSGFGFDLGFTIAKIDVERQKEVTSSRRLRGGTSCYSFSRIMRRTKIKEQRPDYLWKIGVSVTDIGSLNFSNNTQGYKVTDASFYYKNGEKLFGEDAAHLDTVLLRKLRENGKVTTYNSLSLITPAQIHVQADFRFAKVLAASFGLDQRIGNDNAANQLRRINHLLIGPRFESSWFEFGVPINVYEWNEFNVGLTARIGPLSFGSDRIGEIFGLKSIYGADIWASIRIFNFGDM